ncbi:protein diaphanous homolog 1-like isoform X2 [Epinephelus fuscoguttatus]|uniref:protein diaphanous homolog 1-like isoform X2 n=2 Tax=Epinephelus fuscoguttatus TaxID=293821 RepID=UPI0020D19C10|nr:protein diaphanous homolog 1-like isoform X2 [Epinephelus fuscoguttatus]
MDNDLGGRREDTCSANHTTTSCSTTSPLTTQTVTMFHVVQYFDAAKSVAVVPQSWYSAGFTLWPNYTSDERINKAVRCAEVPGQNWTRHPVRVLKTYDDYMSAWRGMKKSLTCDTSELDSHDEDSPVGRVKRTPNPVHYYGDTEEESDTECVPKKKAISQKGSTPVTHPQQSSASPLSSRSNAPSTRPSSFAAPPLPPQPPPGLFSIAAPPPPPPRLSSTAAPPPSPSPPGPSAHAAPPELPPPEPTLTELTSFVTSHTSSFHPPPPGLSSFAPQPPLPSFEHFHSSQSTNPLETASEVFMPTLRAGQSGKEPIPCTPAELHMLTLLENLKHQLNQQSSVMNLLMS